MFVPSVDGLKSAARAGNQKVDVVFQALLFFKIPERSHKDCANCLDCHVCDTNN